MNLGKSIFATRLQSAMKSKDKYDIINYLKTDYNAEFDKFFTENTMLLLF